MSNATRGLTGGGETSGGASDVIDYVTIASTGNALDFGNLLSAKFKVGGAAGATRGLFGKDAVIQYVTFSSTGNALDFGDLTASFSPAGCSNNHGGLA